MGVLPVIEASCAWVEGSRSEDPVEGRDTAVEDGSEATEASGWNGGAEAERLACQSRSTVGAGAWIPCRP